MPNNLDDWQRDQCGQSRVNKEQRGNRRGPRVRGGLLAVLYDHLKYLKEKTGILLTFKLNLNWERGN